MPLPRLPGKTDRITIVGVTGSGKTQAALWHLSMRDFDHMPWVIYDFKYDDHIAEIEGKDVDLDFVPGKKDRGVFIVHPLPETDDDAVKDQLWKLHARENVGIWIDEGYMVKNPAMNAILTQGRSKHIPVIMLVQRPVWCSRFVFSEAGFIQVFMLNDERDESTVNGFTRNSINFKKHLPHYHSYYYDVGRRKLWTFAPVPERDTILQGINSQLGTKRRFL